MLTEEQLKKVKWAINSKPVIIQLEVESFNSINMAIEKVIDKMLDSKFLSHTKLKFFTISNIFTPNFLQFRRFLLKPLKIPIPKGERPFYIIMEPFCLTFDSDNNETYIIDMQNNNELYEMILIKRYF